MTIVLKIPSPDSSNNAFTSLSLDAPIGATSLTVIDTTGFKVDDYTTVGSEGTETCEITQVLSGTAPTIMNTTALENGHISGEQIKVIRYNKIEIYRAATKTGVQSLIATLDISVENPAKETVYFDTTGDDTMWYQAAFLNQTTNDRVFGTIFPGGVHEYASVNDFRMTTGLSALDVSDEKVKWYLTEAYNHILHEGYIFIRYDVLNNTTTPTGDTRWYFHNKYIADGDLNAVVNVDDIKVYEYDDYTLTDITSQVATFDALQGFITLNIGYPTTNKGIKASYYIASRPFDELSMELKQAAINKAAWHAMREMGLRFTKKGVTGYSLDGVNISRSKAEFDKSMEEFEKKYQYYIWIIKSLYVRSFKLGGYESPETFSRFRGYY